MCRTQIHVHNATVDTADKCCRLKACVLQFLLRNLSHHHSFPPWHVFRLTPLNQHQLEGKIFKIITVLTKLSLRTITS